MNLHLKWAEKHAAAHPIPNGLVSRLAALLLSPYHRKPRYWSNIVLRQIAPAFGGRVLNCSGWADEDKFGGHYRDYFTGATEYQVSNWEGGPQKGMYSELPGSIALDLEQPLPRQLRGSFDVVLSHTVLEHVFQVKMAVATLAELATDAVIVVVPFTQLVHRMEDAAGNTVFGDYWRFTPECIEKLFAPHGLTKIFADGTDIPGSSCYYCIALSRYPERYSLPRPEVTIGTDVYTKLRARNLVKYIIGRRAVH